MKKIFILLSIFLCMQYKAAMEEVIKAADQLKKLYQNKTYTDFGEINNLSAVIIKNLIPAWEEATKNEVNDDAKYGVINTLIKAFVEKNIIEQSKRSDLGSYCDHFGKYLNNGDIWIGSYTDLVLTEDKTVSKEKLWNLWTPQFEFVKSIIEYAKSQTFPKKNLKENIEVLARFPEESDTTIKEYQQTFVSSWGIENIKKFIEDMSYSDFYLNVLTSNEKKNVFMYITKFLTEYYTKNKNSDDDGFVTYSQEEYTKQVLIEVARYLYGLDNATDLDTIFAEVVDGQEKNAIIKQIEEWQITHVVRKNPGKATAGILGTILGAFGLHKLYQYYQGKK